LIFTRTRHFSVSNDGLIFIGIGIGSTLATVINYWFLRRYPRLLKEWYGFPLAEERLYPAMVGGPVLVIGIFCLGWSGNYESVPWWVPGMSTILIGLAITLIFTSFIVRGPVFPWAYEFCLTLMRRATDVPGRHLPDVRSFRGCREHDHPLFNCRRIPALFDANVRQPGHQLGGHAPWLHRPNTSSDTVLVLQVRPAHTHQEHFRTLR
jgi:hypothetical protein